MVCPVIQICTWTSLLQSVHAASWTGSSNCKHSSAKRSHVRMSCLQDHTLCTDCLWHSLSQSICLSVWSKQQEQPCSCATGACINRTWAARYNTWLLSKLTPKGIVFSFLHQQARLSVVSIERWTCCVLLDRSLHKRWGDHQPAQAIDDGTLACSLVQHQELCSPSNNVLYDNTVVTLLP